MVKINWVNWVNNNIFMLRIFDFTDQNYEGEWKTKVINMLMREIQDIYKAEQVYIQNKA